MSDEITAEQIIPGPCEVCGRTNYGLSMGGPTICPQCDCGSSPTICARTIAALNTRIAELEADLKRAVGALGSVLARDAEWSPSGSPTDCNCINLSRETEQEYEAVCCPHQLARALIQHLKGTR